MAYTLSGVWEFNETLSETGWAEVNSNYIQIDGGDGTGASIPYDTINFTSNGKEFFGFGIYTTNKQDSVNRAVNLGYMYYLASNIKMAYPTYYFSTGGSGNKDRKWAESQYYIVDFGTTPQSVRESFYTWFTKNATYIGESVPEEPEEPTTDTKPVYKRVDGAWVKQNAYERVNGEWVKISSEVEGTTRVLKTGKYVFSPVLNSQEGVIGKTYELTGIHSYSGVDVTHLYFTYIEFYSERVYLGNLPLYRDGVFNDSMATIYILEDTKVDKELYNWFISNSTFMAVDTTTPHSIIVNTTNCIGHDTNPTTVKAFENVTLYFTDTSSGYNAGRWATVLGAAKKEGNYNSTTFWVTITGLEGDVIVTAKGNDRNEKW